MRRAVAVLVGASLVLGACAPGGDEVSGAPYGPSPRDAAAPGPSVAQPTERPAAEPAAPWPAAVTSDDLARIEAWSDLLTQNWHSGTEGAFAFLAAHAWPRGYTGASLRTCRLGVEAPSYAQLDEDRMIVHMDYEDAVPAPDWRFPPTDELLADAGIRIYRAELTELVRGFGTFLSSDVQPAHVGVDADGDVVVFPKCLPHHPELGLTHVGLAAAFDALSPLSQDTACREFAELGAEAVRSRFVETGWLVPVEVIDEFFTRRCAGVA